MEKTNKVLEDNFVELTPPPENFDPSEIEELLQDVGDTPMFHSFLFYGVSGIGKSRIAASGGEGTLIINCNERKPVSIRKSNAKIITIRRVPEDIEKVYWWLRGGAYKRFHTVALDSLTALLEMFKRYVVTEECKKNPAKHKIQTDLRDYGIANDHVKIWITNFRNLQDVMNVVFIALERPTDEKHDKIRPDLTPGCSNAAESAVDIIGRMYLTEIEHKGKEMIVPIIWFGPHEDFMTKETTFTLGDKMLLPTMPKIIKKIKEGYNK